MTVAALTEEELTTYARGIATGQMLVADLRSPSWQVSLALMLPEIAKEPNVGLILVPMEGHHHMPWINNTAPGITLKCVMIPRESVEALDDLAQEMLQALNPQPKQPTDKAVSP